MVRFGSVIVLIVAAVCPAFGDVRVAGVVDNSVVADASVCFYHVAPAEPLAKAFVLRCYPSDSALQIPNAVFGVFAKRDPDLIATHHAVVYGAKEPKPGVSTLRLELRPAAQLNLAAARQQGPRSAFAVIVAETPTNRPTVMPLDDVEELALVPAGVALVPLAMEEGRITAVGPLLRLEPGVVETVELTPADRATVLIRFRADDPTPEPPDPAGCAIPYSSAFLRSLSKIPVPVVELIDVTGKVHSSDVVALDSSNLFESVYVFRSVAHGTARLNVHGPGWVTTTNSISIGAEQAVHVPPPTLITPAGTLKVTVDTFGLTMIQRCDTTEPNEVRVGVFRCPADGEAPLTDGFLRQECTHVVTEEIDVTATAEVVFPRLPPSQYVVAVSMRDRLTNATRTQVFPGRTAGVHVPLTERYIGGRVTRDGRAVPADVRFRTGSAVTNPDTGEYVALLSGPPEKAMVTVIACDESFVHMHTPSSPVPFGFGYDFQLPDHEVAVRVRDARTHAPIEDADVTVGAVDPSDGERTIGIVPAIRDEGQFVARTLEKDSHIRACASRQRYKYGCTEPIVVSRRRQEVTLDLQPLRHEGRVDPVGYTTLFWVRPDGTVREHVSIGDDGAFFFNEYNQTDHLVLTGIAPLWVTKPPELSPTGQLDLHPPRGATRSVLVRLSEQSPKETVTVLVWANGLPVPFSALAAHQTRRRARWLIVARAPITIGDLFAGDILAATDGPDPETTPGLLEGHMPVFVGRHPEQIRGPEITLD